MRRVCLFFLFAGCPSKGLAENPLWHAVLRAAGGDGEKALAMLADPEALQKHPEVMKRAALHSCSSDSFTTLTCYE